VPPKAAPAAEPLLDIAEEDDTLELGTDEDSEELLLDNDDILTSPVTSAPIAPPADEDLAGNDVPAPVPVRETGTLFERMSNIARGAAQAKVDGDESGSGSREPLDIPRFLNRQNNQ
jgi:cell division protein FtsZ